MTPKIFHVLAGGRSGCGLGESQEQRGGIHGKSVRHTKGKAASVSTEMMLIRCQAFSILLLAVCVQLWGSVAFVILTQDVPLHTPDVGFNGRKPRTQQGNPQSSIRAIASTARAFLPERRKKQNPLRIGKGGDDTHSTRAARIPWGPSRGAKETQRALSLPEDNLPNFANFDGIKNPFTLIDDYFPEDNLPYFANFDDIKNPFTLVDDYFPAYRTVDLLKLPNNTAPTLDDYSLDITLQLDVRARIYQRQLEPKELAKLGRAGAGVKILVTVDWCVFSYVLFCIHICSSDALFC